MIKRLLWLLVLFVCAVPYANAQQGLQGYVVTGTGAQARIVLTGSAIVFHQLTWNVTGTVSSCTVALDTSADGVSWSAGNAIAGQTCTSNGQSALSTSAVFNFVRVNTTAFSGTGSVVVTWAGYVATPGGLPSGCTSPGTGAITCTGTVAANALTSTTSVSTGSGASAAGATATGGFAAVEAASTGWTPTAGQDYCRADSTVHNFVCALNGAAETPQPMWSAVPVGGKCAQTTGVAGFLVEATGACNGAPAYPQTVSGMTSGGVLYGSSATQVSSSALLAANALVVGGGAGAAPATGSGDFTYASHTLTGGAAGLLDLSAMTGLGALRIPKNASPVGGSSEGGLSIFDNGGGNPALQWDSGLGAPGARNVALAGISTNYSTTCTNQVVTVVSSFAIPTCSTITSAYADSSIAKTAAYVTATNCASSASPAVCGSAAAGSVAVPTGVTPTLVVNTTAVTANSQILFTPDESLGTRLSVTCNSTIAQVAIEPIVTARTTATSFTIQYNTTITVNPICLSYFIVN